MIIISLKDFKLNEILKQFIYIVVSPHQIVLDVLSLLHFNHLLYLMRKFLLINRIFKVFLNFFCNNWLIIILLSIWFFIAFITLVLLNHKILIFFIFFCWPFFDEQMLLVIFRIGRFLYLIIIWLNFWTYFIAIRLILLLILVLNF